MNLKIGMVLKPKEDREFLGIRTVIEVFTNSAVLQHDFYGDIWSFENIEKNFDLPKEEWVLEFNGTGAGGAGGAGGNSGVGGGGAGVV